MQLGVEELLVYPLLDLDAGAYTGPKEMGVSLPPELDRRLRDLQNRWQASDAERSEDEDAAWVAEYEAVERDLASALHGTGWVLVPHGERTEEQRRRRRKSKR